VQHGEEHGLDRNSGDDAPPRRNGLHEMAAQHDLLGTALDDEEHGQTENLPDLGGVRVGPVQPALPSRRHGDEVSTQDDQRDHQADPHLGASAPQPQGTHRASVDESHPCPQREPHPPEREEHHHRARPRCRAGAKESSGWHRDDQLPDGQDHQRRHDDDHGRQPRGVRQKGVAVGDVTCLTGA